VRNWAQLLFWGLLATAIGLALWQHTQLPARVATHFDFQGRPNGWMARETHTIAEIVLLLLMGGLFQGLAWFNDRLPIQFINVPHRDYWLTGERRAASMAWLRQLFLLIGSGLVVNFGVLFWQVYLANVRGEPRLTSAAVLPVLVGAGVVIVVVAILRRFRRPPNLV